MVLNINRESMANVGFSPPTRVFEAAGAGACVVTDAWAGIETFFAPGAELLVARDAAEVVIYLRGIDARQARSIGDAMRSRALAAHTYAMRARHVHEILTAASQRHASATTFPSSLARVAATEPKTASLGDGMRTQKLA
jgi:spore maturation protein CgeB